MLSYLKKFGSPDADTAAKIGASLFVLKDHWHDASAYSLLSALVAAADHYGRENGVFHSLEIAVMKEYRSSIVSFLSSQLEAACSLPDGPFEFAFTKPGHCAYSLFLKAQRVSDVLKAMEDGQEFVDGSVKVTTVDPKEEIKHKKEDKENACGDEDGEDDEDEVVSDTYDSHVGHVIITAIAEVNQANIIVELLLSEIIARISLTKDQADEIKYEYAAALASTGKTYYSDQKAAAQALVASRLASRQQGKCTKILLLCACSVLAIAVIVATFSPTFDFAVFKQPIQRIFFNDSTADDDFNNTQ